MRALINPAKIRLAQSQRSSPQRSIQNLIQGKAYQQASNQDKLQAEDIERKENLRQRKIKRMAYNNSERRESWIQKVERDPMFVEQYVKGNIPIVHPDHHQFRDFGARTALKLDKESTIIIPKIYDSQNYQNDQPHIKNNFREKKHHKMISGLEFKYQPQTNEERISEALKNGTPLSTEPLNTLLIKLPKWRVHDKAKWIDKKDFNAQMTSRDKTWERFDNTSASFFEPYNDYMIQFRSSNPNVDLQTMNPASLTTSDFNMSFLNSQSQVNQESLQAINKATKGKQKVQSSTPFSSQLKKRQEQKIFDSSFPADSIWRQRLIQQISLRQRAHLNQTLRMKQVEKEDNFSNRNYAYNILNLDGDRDSKQEDEDDIIQKTATPNTKVNEFFKFNREPQSNKISPTRQDKHMTGQLSRVISESYDSPDRRREGDSQISPKRVHSPIQIKKKVVVNLAQTKPQTAAKLLNHSLNRSYTNSWQYKIIQPSQQTNAKIAPPVVDLSDSHIMHELDKVKTYYNSLAGRLSLKSSEAGSYRSIEREKFKMASRGRQTAISSTVSGAGRVNSRMQIGNPNKKAIDEYNGNKQPESQKFDRNAYKEITATPISIAKVETSKDNKRYSQSNVPSPISIQKYQMNQSGRSWMPRESFSNTSALFGEKYLKGRSSAMDGASIKEAIDKYFNREEKRQQSPIGSPKKAQLK